MEDANCAYQLGKLATKAQQLTEAVTFFEEVCPFQVARECS